MIYNRYPRNRPNVAKTAIFGSFRGSINPRPKSEATEGDAMNRFAFLVALFTATTWVHKAQAELVPGNLPVIDCSGDNCQRISTAGVANLEALIKANGLPEGTTPESLALLCDTTGNCPNLAHGAVWITCTRIDAGQMWFDPTECRLTTPTEVRTLTARHGCNRVEYGINRRHVGHLTAFKELPLADKLYRGGPTAIESYFATHVAGKQCPNGQLLNTATNKCVAASERPSAGNLNASAIAAINKIADARVCEAVHGTYSFATGTCTTPRNPVFGITTFVKPEAIGFGALALMVIVLAWFAASRLSEEVTAHLATMRSLWATRRKVAYLIDRSIARRRRSDRISRQIDRARELIGAPSTMDIDKAVATLRAHVLRLCGVTDDASPHLVFAAVKSTADQAGQLRGAMLAELAVEVPEGGFTGNTPVDAAIKRTATARMDERAANTKALLERTTELETAHANHETALQQAATRERDLKTEIDRATRALERTMKAGDELTAERNALTESMRVRTEELATTERLHREALNALHQRMIEELHTLGITIRGPFDGPLEAIAAMHLALCDHYRQARGALTVVGLNVKLENLASEARNLAFILARAQERTEQAVENATRAENALHTEHDRAETLGTRVDAAETALRKLRDNRAERLGLLGITCFRQNGHVVEDLLEQFRLLDGERDAVYEVSMQQAVAVSTGLAKFLVEYGDNLLYGLEHPRCSKDSRRGKPAHAARKQVAPLVRSHLDRVAQATRTRKTLAPVAAVA